MQVTRALAAAAVLCLAAPVIGHGQQPVVEHAEEAIATWAGHNYQHVLDATLPLSVGDLPKTVEWMVCARVIPAFEPEFQLCLQKEYGGRVQGAYAAPRGASVGAQLRALRKSHLTATADELTGLIAIDRRTVNGPRPHLAKLAQDLEALTIPARLPNALVMDDTAYELELRSQYGSQLRVTLSGSAKTNQVIRWVDDAARLLGQRR